MSDMDKARRAELRELFVTIVEAMHAAALAWVRNAVEWKARAEQAERERDEWKAEEERVRLEQPSCLACSGTGEGCDACDGSGLAVAQLVKQRDEARDERDAMRRHLSMIGELELYDKIRNAQMSEEE